MKTGDECFISDPHNGDISGWVNGSEPCYRLLLRCELPVRWELLAARLVSHLPPPGPDSPLPSSLPLSLFPSRYQREERREKLRRHTPGKGATETGKVSSSGGGNEWKRYRSP